MRRGGHPTSERIYRVVKQQLLQGAFRPGERIEAAQLADHHNASITPVRAALHRLVGERLVEARPSEGFHAPLITEPGLRDLYIWNSQVLLAALHLAGAAGPGAPTLEAADADPVSLIERVFVRLAERSGNEACLRAVESLNDRLHLARRVEPQVLSDMAAEAAAVAAVATRDPIRDSRPAILQYHRRRLRVVTDIVRLAHRWPSRPGLG